MIGRIVSHHQITDQLGAGGMGVVYRPRDLTLGRDVTLKLLPGTMLADPEAVPNFARKVRKDGRFVALLEHHGLIPQVDGRF